MCRLKHLSDSLVVLACTQQNKNTTFLYVLSIRHNVIYIWLLCLGWFVCVCLFVLCASAAVLVVFFHCSNLFFLLPYSHSNFFSVACRHIFARHSFAFLAGLFVSFHRTFSFVLSSTKKNLETLEKKNWISSPPKYAVLIAVWNTT